MPALRGTPQGAAASAANVAVSVPAGVVDGDFLLAAITGSKFNGLTPATPVTPAGWTQLGIADTTLVPASTNSEQVGLYGRVASSEPAGYTFSITVGLGDLYIDASIIAYRDVDPVTPLLLGPTSAVGLSSAPTSAGLGATSVDLCWHVLFFSAYANNMGGVVAGYTSDILYDAASSEWMHRIVSPAGGTGARVEGTPTSDVWLAWALALQPAAGSGGRSPHWYLSSRIV